MDTHDAILMAHIKQAQTANNCCKPTPFTENDLVHLSTKNLHLPKGNADKLAPKSIGPFMILKYFRNGSFQLDIPCEMHCCGLHSMFHSLLLHIHILNDDSHFLGCQLHQIITFSEDTEWKVNHTLSHTARVWLPFQCSMEIERLSGCHYIKLSIPLHSRHILRYLAFLQPLNFQLLSICTIGNTRTWH